MLELDLDLTGFKVEYKREKTYVADGGGGQRKS
jgi:hypothetical protein